jgi:hypothetical protein
MSENGSVALSRSDKIWSPGIYETDDDQGEETAKDTAYRRGAGTESSALPAESDPAVRFGGMWPTC